MAAQHAMNVRPQDCLYQPLQPTAPMTRRCSYKPATIAVLTILVVLTGAGYGVLDMSIGHLSTEIARLHATLQRIAPVRDDTSLEVKPKACLPMEHDATCIQTPKEYVDLLAARSNGSAPLDRTACVSDNLLGRMYTGAFKPASWELDPVLSSSPARRVIFAVGPRMLEKILVWGHNSADMTVKSLGYGDSFTCGAAPDWKGTCQYRLIVWRSPCTTKKYGPLVRGDWANLQDFLVEEYGSDLPDITEQVAVLENANFKDLTGCDPDILAPKSWDPATQLQAGCSDAYRAAMAKFPYAKCADPAPRYSPLTKCPAEDALLHSGTPPTALELRAFLMATQGFAPQYTGYSYTANTYSKPLSQEFWVHNSPRSELWNAVVASMWNDTANSL